MTNNSHNIIYFNTNFYNKNLIVKVYFYNN